jgi:hypothetical protein
MACIALMVPVLAAAQGTAAGSGSAATAGTSSVAQAASGSDDLQVVLSEPDFTLGALPTTLRLPKGKMAFRITHRFTYKINGSSVGDFFDNAFGFDSSATVGFELRYGLASGTQLSVHRTNSQNIQFMAQHQVRQQGSTGRFSADVLMALEGQDNFREEHSIVVGGVFSHKFDEKGAVYVEPMGVFNATPEFPSSDRNTMVLGLGARLRIAKSKAYVVAEFAPRLGGYDGGSSLMTFGIEKRMGGHSFQLNVSNAFGTTLTQVGHGGPDPKHWHLGFNLSRKFY